ncbi:MAG: hypothetical protein L6R38_001483 [Xanthoria sp. 2 TBL-2021]|nr:MAG: hypothetical protein L6R38_001483 [Xanthoria sp. 2 TBL-2021]
MSSCVAELDAILQSMLTMKAPGVSGSKINSITQLCNANIQSESVLIQKIYTHFKKAPGPYKLGVLYVVDSVTRSWVEQARKAGQQPSASAAYGTYGAGVYRVTELLPMLMSDISNSAPEDQKARIKKLIDIWERGNTFPNEMLSSFKEKLDAPAHGVKSTTPLGSPPKDFIPLTNGSEQPVNSGGHANGAPPADTSAILKALADMAKTNTGTPVQASASNVTNFQNSFPQNVPAPVNQAPSVPPASRAVGVVPGVNGGATPFVGSGSASGNFPPNLPLQPPNVQLPAPMPIQGNGAPAMTPEVQQQLEILKALQAQGVPQDQWATVLSVVMAQAGGAMPNQQAAPPQHGWQQAGGYGDQSRDRNGFDKPSLRSPSGRFRNARSRSRSPVAWDRRNASPPHRRDSPVYGEYARDAHNNDRGGFGRSDRGRGGNQFRQRSPDRNRRSPSPRRASHERGLPPPGPKMVEYDPNLRQGTIKVLSRTLFVGGVTCSDDELREIFAQFGIVQTCIVNVDKRHAFVKMISRKDAQQARDGMERYKSPDMQLRTRWGVGFGPRDCSDYSTGISIVPIARLTDADCKWMLTAEYGGSGGKPIDSGMVVEEPDIEIGAGVSSKAISRRMATDQGGYQGPRSSRDGPAFNPNRINNNANGSRFRQPDRSQDREIANPNHNAIGVPPVIPNFGFQFPTLPNGMPMFPPGMMPPGPPGPS